MSVKINHPSNVPTSYPSRNDTTASAPPASSGGDAVGADRFESGSEVSGLGRILLSQGVDKSAISRFAQDKDNLAGITPREGQRAIEALASGRTSKADERGIVNILSSMSPSVRGESLRLLEGGGDRYNIEHLLSDDIDNKALRNEAKALINEARPFMKSGERTIISDIDDTVKPWKDKTVDGPVFPGARALYRALDLGVDGKGTAGDVHFVTARDGFVVKAEKDIKNTGIDTGSIRYGDGVSGLLSLLGFNKGVEERKVKNITEMLQRNPSSQAVLVGDSTQADPQVFARILDSHPDRVELAMIHRVSGFPIPPEIENNDKVLVFDNYAEAAQVLHQRGMISEAQLADVLADR
ncbi:MAG: DUF2183 domain-containing protein [Myxococcales bacterium]|nr:DUF2183 domain-containing protein [Myxococcales bacterium]